MIRSSKTSPPNFRKATGKGHGGQRRVVLGLCPWSARNAKPGSALLSMYQYPYHSSAVIKSSQIEGPVCLGRQVATKTTRGSSFKAVRWLDLSSYDTNSLPYQCCTHFGRQSDGGRSWFGLHCEKYLESPPRVPGRDVVVDIWGASHAVTRIAVLDFTR